MKLTILVLESNGMGTRSVHTSVPALLGALMLGVAALGAMLWVGWQIGELTKLL